MGNKALKGTSPILKKIRQDKMDEEYYEKGGYAPPTKGDFKSKLKKSMTKKDKSILGKKIYK
jgi:hypothetical protein